MNLAEIFIIALGLAMDAFAVSICLGLAGFRGLKNGRGCADAKGEERSNNAGKDSVPGLQKLLIPAVYFGLFQALMPAIGYFCAKCPAEFVESYSHLSAFVLLFLIGANMIRESSKCSENTFCGDMFGFKNMIMLAFATSVDAFAAGITFAFLKAGILRASVIIGIVTFLISAAGVKTGQIFGEKYKSHAEIFGGVILIGLAFKVLLENLFI